MLHINSPAEFKTFDPSLFMAGGITDCPNWQLEMCELLKDEDLVVYNPRQANYARHDLNAERQQIEWEYRYLREADAISFWFPQETLCPISLYELGAWSVSNIPIFVGAHPQYPRYRDVVIQTGLVRPNVIVVPSLASLAEQVKMWLITGQTTKPI